MSKLVNKNNDMYQQKMKKEENKRTQVHKNEIKLPG